MSLDTDSLIAQLRLQFDDLQAADLDYQNEDYETFIGRGVKDLNFYLNTAYTMSDFPELWEPVLLCAAWAHTMQAELRRIGKLADHDVEGQSINWTSLHTRVKDELTLASECVEKGIKNIQKNLRAQRKTVMIYHPRQYPTMPGDTVAGFGRRIVTR